MALPTMRSLASAAGGPLSIQERLQAAITPGLCATLARHGVAVADGVFGAEVAAALRDEVAALRPHMHPNATHLVNPTGQVELVPKRGILEAELGEPATQALAPLCASLQRDATLRTLLSLHLPTGPRALPGPLDRQAIKLQWNGGGGAAGFPIHFDDMATDGRAVTAIWYLNPEWEPSHGGELRVYPFPHGRAIDIPPAADRLVLFWSQRTAHRVLPSHADRYCFTIWLSCRVAGAGAGAGAGAAAAAQRAAARAALASRDPLAPAAAAAVLDLEEVRKHALKWVYREEWAQSLEESHPPGPATAALLERFWREVGVIERALGPLLPALEAWREREGAEGG